MDNQPQYKKLITAADKKWVWTNRRAIWVDICERSYPDKMDNSPANTSIYFQSSVAPADPANSISNEGKQAYSKSPVAIFTPIWWHQNEKRGMNHGHEP